MTDYVRALLGKRRFKTAADAARALSAAESRWSAALARGAAVAKMQDEDAAVPLLEAKLEANRRMREDVGEMRARTVEDK